MRNITLNHLSCSIEAVGSHGRIGANDVERLVVETLSRQLSRPELMNDVATGIWSEKTRTLVRDAVEQVVLGKGEVKIFRRAAAVSSSSVEAGDGDAPTIHTVPAPSPQPRARTKIIASGGGSNATPRRLSHDLVLAIARAKTWMRDLRSRQYSDTVEIAQRFKLNNAHVRRLLRFGYLAPDIVETIVEGRQPRSLTVKRLLQGIPCAWLASARHLD
jgi:hypothetical protein